MLDPQTGTSWVVTPEFKSGTPGIDQFNAIATKCFSADPVCPTQQLAIVLDQEVVSAPSITETPTFERDEIVITGSFTEDSAKNLALVLRYGALPVTLEPQQTQTVSATLGEDSLRAGLVAGIIGLLFTAIFMVAYYRLLGIVAIASLILEFILVWVLISYLGESRGLALTLAGVTGLIVSIGISVDSNIVFYEHLKEDVHNGRTFRSTVERSFDSSFSTIIKADVASLIGAVLLYFLSIGPVRGFALLLGLSTIIDIIASWFFIRPAVLILSRRPRWRENTSGLRHAEGRGGDDMTLRSALRDVYQNRNDFNFIKTFRWGLIVAAVICVISITSLVTRGLNLGIDFEGGSVWELPTNGASVDDARDVMTDAGESGAKIQLVTAADGTERFRIQADVTTQEQTSEITRALADLAGVGTDEVTVNTVGPSWGDEITEQALRALIFFFIAISLYISIRLEWKMAVGALVSMVHDLLLSVGVYSILQIEVTPATLISFLTILGYSLYDTIVVFDRAQELSRAHRVQDAVPADHEPDAQPDADAVGEHHPRHDPADRLDAPRRLRAARCRDPRGVRPGPGRRPHVGRLLVAVRGRPGGRAT